MKASKNIAQTPISKTPGGPAAWRNVQLNWRFHPKPRPSLPGLLGPPPSPAPARVPEGAGKRIGDRQGLKNRCLSDKSPRGRRGGGDGGFGGCTARFIDNKYTGRGGPLWLGGLQEDFVSLPWCETQTTTLLNPTVGTNSPTREVLKHNLHHHRDHRPKDSTTTQTPLGATANAVWRRGESQARPGGAVSADRGCQHAPLRIYQSNPFHRHLPHRRVQEGALG